MLQFTPIRTQSSGWIWEFEYSQLQKISLKLEAILNLRVLNMEDRIGVSEGYQVKYELGLLKNYRGPKLNGSTKATLEIRVSQRDLIKPTTSHYSISIFYQGGSAPLDPPE